MIFLQTKVRKRGREEIRKSKKNNMNNFHLFFLQRETTKKILSFQIPSQTARALHFICDNENPMINNVVIFLTLTPLTDVGMYPIRNQVKISDVCNAHIF